MIKPEPMCFLIADISGYTNYLAGVELDHARTSWPTSSGRSLPAFATMLEHDAQTLIAQLARGMTERMADRPDEPELPTPRRVGTA